MSLPTFVGWAVHSRSLPWAEFRHAVRFRSLQRELNALRGRGYRLIVVDEGPVFALTWLQLFGNPRLSTGAPAQWWAGAVGRSAATLDAIILVDAPDTTLAGRIRGRPKRLSVREGTDLEIQEFSDRFRAAFRRVISAITDRGGPPVVMLNSGEDAPQELADRVLRELEPLRDAG